MEIFHQKIPGKVTHFRLLSKAGARYDPAGKEGLAHLLEHIALMSGFPNFQSYMKNSAYLNAKTTPESVVFDGQIYTKNFPSILQRFSTCLDVCQLNDTILDRERKIVFNEIEPKYFRPDIVSAAKKYLQTLYGKHPWSRLINLTGIPDSLLAIDADDLRQCQQKFFVRPNFTVLVAAPVAIEKIKPIIEENLTVPEGEKPPGTVLLDDFPKPETDFICLHSESESKDKNFENHKEVIVFSAAVPSRHVPANTNPIRMALRMAILEKLRDGDCSVYNVEVLLSRMRDVSTLTIHTSLSPKNEQKAIKLIREAISSFSKNSQLFDNARKETLFYLELDRTELPVEGRLNIAELDVVLFDKTRKLGEEINYAKNLNFWDAGRWVDEWLTPERILVSVSKF